MTRPPLSVCRPLLQPAGLAALSVCVLTACAMTLGPGDRVEQVPPEDGLVVLSAPEFEAGTARHVRHTDSWQQEEYVLLAGRGAQAEIVYAAVTETPIALTYPYAIQGAVDRWHFNRGKRKIWDGSDRRGTLFDPIFYRRYRLADEDRDCFGFSAEWDHPSDDPWSRPGRVLFGYYCAAPGASLSDEKISRLISGLSAKDPRKIRGPVTQPAAERTAAVQIARGSQAEGTGAPGFPFYFAERYNDTDGDGSKH